MYKYQEETIDNIDDAIEKIEKMTEEHYRIHIGFRHTHDFEDENIPIFVEINGQHRFTQQEMMNVLTIIQIAQFIALIEYKSTKKSF